MVNGIHARCIILLGCLLWAVVAKAQVTDDYLTTLNIGHPIKGNVYGYIQPGFGGNSGVYRSYYLEWPGIIYHARRWFQLWASTRFTYKDYLTQFDKDEIRPTIGAKLFFSKTRRLTLSNFTRYQMLATYDHRSREWTRSNWIRSRFGMELPLTRVEKAWQPRSFYAIADVEPIYTINAGWNTLRVRGGVGYITLDKVRVEFLYAAQFGRNTSSEDLERNEVTFRLNIKVGVKTGLLGRIWNP